MAFRPVTYHLLSLAWLALAYLISRHAGDANLLFACAGTLVLGAPILMMGLYSTTISKILKSKAYQPGSLLYRLNAGRLLSTAIWLVVSLAAGFFAVFWLDHLSKLEWTIILLSVPLFACLPGLSYEGLSSQYKPYIATERCLRVSRRLYALLLALCMVAAGLAAGDNGEPQRLTEIIRDYQAQPLDPSQSILVQYASRYSAYIHQIKHIGLSSIEAYHDYLPLLISLAGSFGIAMTIGVALSAFYLPGVEYRRILLPAEDAAIAESPSLASVLMLSVFVVIIPLFVFIPAMAGLEARLKSEPQVTQGLDQAEALSIPLFEKIEGRLYQPGTIAEIRQQQLLLVSEHDRKLEAITPVVESGYRKMKANVDSYLDWYYSLPAEYLRIVALLTASLEESISRDLAEHLGKGDPFADMQSAMDRLLLQSSAAKAQFERFTEDLMRRNQVVPLVRDFEVSEEISLAQLMAPSGRVERIELKLRAAGAGVGALSGIVAAKVVGKTAAKGTVQLAAKAITKATFTKSASATAGAGAGAIVGSVVPGAGTAVGAAIGATVGLLVGVSVDALLLTVEEYLSRDEFRQEIIESIDATRLEFYRGLGVEAP